jgi:hypothetical protein
LASNKFFIITKKKKKRYLKIAKKITLFDDLEHKISVSFVELGIIHQINKKIALPIVKFCLKLSSQQQMFGLNFWRITPAF